VPTRPQNYLQNRGDGVERGTLQHPIWDSQALSGFRALVAVPGVILKLPPVKRTLASRLLQSRYLEAVIIRLAR
jgi:hypothetical protein